ncbi:hypothetical protein BGX38DRAFT_760537, partial [Terfezia claveryi]
MQLQQLIFSLLSAASIAHAFTVPTTPTQSAGRLPLAQSDKLRRVLTRKALLKHADKLLKFSQTDPDGNRGFGGVGHNLTVDYLYNTFSTGDMADYYTVEKQMFIYKYAYGTSKVIIEGQTHESLYLTYSPSTNGELKLPLGLAANLGCTPEDYPDLTGRIALVSRGTCEFGLKSVLAGKAGALGII